jgi:FKBP-type peptidyl-prolyl cis-trans isomerase
MRTCLSVAGLTLFALMLVTWSQPLAAAETKKENAVQNAKDELAAPSDVAAPPADAKKSPSGLAYKVLRAGKGTQHPKATDKVEVHYTGWTTNGKMFDSSVARKETIVFPLNGVIKGWTEGVQLMVPGEKSRFWIPAELAYGKNPGSGAPAGMLVFDIELIAIK